MSANSKISWTHHTFNLIWGCEKIAPECASCYAEAWARRMGYHVWGKDQPRRTLSEKYWREPFKWNARAEKNGERARVFCGSMCDWLEDHPTVHQERLKLFPLIEQTPRLDWLLLSKRNENFDRAIPEKWCMEGVPENVWIGMTAGCQETWNACWPILESIKYRFHRLAFVSVEPMIGPLDISNDLVYIDIGDEDCTRWIQWPDWIIIGGESEQPGRQARKMELEWARSLIAQCKKNDVSVYVKQLGSAWAREAGVFEEDSHGANPEYWPMDMRVRGFPNGVTII